MDAMLLCKLFGNTQDWRGPCTVILNADSTVEVAGSDNIGSGGSKVFAPRTTSGRMAVDAACLLQDGSALIVAQQHRTRTPSGEENVKQTFAVADARHIVAIEFSDGSFLAALGVNVPVLKPLGSNSGIHQRPKIS